MIKRLSSITHPAKRFFDNTVLSRLNSRGIMGMNRRNISYISRYNPREFFPLVDDKLKTKRLALEHGVTVPELVAVVGSQHDISKTMKVLLTLDGFCIKPSKGSGGKGILVITRVEDGKFYRSNGQVISEKDIRRHLSNILAGLFSLGGAVDVAMIEALMIVDPKMKTFSHEGVPDIRVIVFRGVPVMAMMRLACASSQGKANLHQGAIGVGLDINSGEAVHALQHDDYITHHPDTNADLQSLRLGQWQGLLELACACYDMGGLGYLGVDLVMDANLGPTLLELNARPGLSIQIANNAGLLPRLRLVEAIKHPERMSIDQRVSFAREQFAVREALEESIAE